MSDPISEFLAAIDHEVAATDSVVRRYRHAVRFEPEAESNERIESLLETTSLREGLRIVPLMNYEGVSIDVLDESSMMATRTLKSIDGCIAAARCLDAGIERCVFESGGNTGSALTLYAGSAGLETYLFLPVENLDLLDTEVFGHLHTHLITVGDPGQVKPSAHAFAERHAIERIPKPGWRHQASRLIGCFLLEHALKQPFYDCMVQSISAAFGPIGIYHVLDRGLASHTPRPRFIGIQQAANCPMYRAWRGEKEAADGQPVRSTRKLLTRVMYDNAPQTYGTFEALRQLLIDTGGHLDTLDHDEFSAGLGRQFEAVDLVDLLANADIHIGKRDGEILEKAGLIALLGALKQIDSGRIQPGERVLVCFTGGTGRPDGRVVADHHIETADQIAEIHVHNSRYLESQHG
mgnify:CR=1 FL=1